jgi:DNA-binding transcriptional LysR family regulator
MNFTLDQLLALDAIVRTGSFAAAASDLHKVPSAVSYAVQSLESALGVEVFDRSRRKAELTPAGQRVLEGARQVIDSGHRLVSIARDLQNGWEPELHVLVDGALPMEAVLSCIRRFAEPDVPTQLRLEVQYQEGVIDGFEHSGGDLALCIGFDGDGDAEGYDCIPLPPLDLVLVVSAEHPLANGPVTEAGRLSHAELVVRDSSPRFTRRSKPSFLGSGNVVYLSDFHSKRIGLLQGAGYGWIPRHFIEADLDSGSLQVLECETNSWTYQPQVISKSGREIGRAGRLFLETIGATFDG